MKKHISIATVITLMLIIVSVIVSATYKKDSTSTLHEQTSTQEEKEDSYMKGMWVSYISLDMSGTDYSEKSFRAKFDDIINTAEEYGCNALFVHTRAFCDALYDSDIFPSSHLLSGTQGVKSEFDALEIMCAEAHKKGIELHAWINPYRVATLNTPYTLAENNPYIKDSSLCIEYDGCIYLNPSKASVRDLITEGVVEIIKNYDVDGIHFDDYFYPTDDESFDNEDYNAYLKGFNLKKDALPLSEWRKNNVNLMVSQVYRAIKDYDKSILFGISPQGNIENDQNMGADVKSWCECVGYVDYICPQLYYSTDNPALKFSDALNSWLEFNLHDKLNIYAGLAVYKAGTSADEGTWENADDILSRELQIINEHKLDGYILYDYNAMKSDAAQDELKVFKEHLG